MMTSEKRDIRHSPSGKQRIMRAIYIVLILLVIAVPFETAQAPFILNLATYGLIAAIVAISLDVLMGNTSLISFGHAGWYGLGTYTGGLFAKYVSADIVLALLACMIVAGIIAFVIGRVLITQIGKTFAILTLAFSQILFSLVFVASGVTGGEDGLQGIPQATFMGWQIASPDAWYWIVLGVVATLLLVAIGVRCAPIGKTWLAIKENEQRGQFIGLNTFRMKLSAYVVSACLAAMGGGMYALFAGSTSPDALNWFASGKILMYVILGGVGTIVGPAIGAIAFTFAEYYVSAVSESWLIYFGGLFVLVVIVAPGGLFGLLRMKLSGVKNERN